ncbi:MAG TPA: hypothetical protein PLB89_03770 [Flavobacteriales bacterium]|nr:hypothetical protein [Flavobacteriales bacterium]
MRTLLLLLWVAVHGPSIAQHLTYLDWQKQSFVDMRLVPRYGNRPKTPEMLASDSAFVAQTLAAIPDRHKAADHLVDLGFQLLREGNMTHAMFRFNQAYLLEPKNPSIYRGYGAFFMAMDRTEEAGRVYADGLEIDSTDSRLMIDLSAAFLAEEYAIRSTYTEKADMLLNGAIGLLNRALHYAPKSADAHFRLSAAYLRKGDCAQARRYYDACNDLGGARLTEELGPVLQAKCPK